MIADVDAHREREQQQVHVNLAATGRSFMGAKAVMAVEPLQSPTTPRPQARLTPRLAAGDDSGALATAKRALKHFRTAYREAWKAFREGLQTRFPGGTLLMRRRFRIACEPLDAACWCCLAVT